ncbi:MAG: NnrU family protein, partial [Pseudomonadota bacterium]
MATFIAGLGMFFATHAFTSFARGPRGALVAKINEAPYKGLYALLSLAGFVLIVQGWSGASAASLYTPPAFLRHVTYLLTVVAFVLMAAAYLPPGRIAAATKHPMLAGVKIWAFAH